jgi:hypothetical protein
VNWQEVADHYLELEPDEDEAEDEPQTLGDA